MLPLPPTLVRGARVSQNALEVADDEIASQCRPRGIEEPAPAVGRDAIRNGDGPQIDIAGERETDRREETRPGFGRRRRPLGSR
jgi:hypothetical protein